MASKKWIVLFFVIFNLFGEVYYFKDKKIELFPEKNLRSLSTIRYYKTRSGKRVGIKDEIIVKIINKNALKNMQIKKQLDKNTYLITAKGDIFLYLQKLYQNKDIIYAVPNMYKKIQRR